jgi:hypothetical protein
MSTPGGKHVHKTPRVLLLSDLLLCNIMQVLFMTNATLQSSTCCLYNFGTVGVTCAHEQSIRRMYVHKLYIYIQCALYLLYHIIYTL